MNHTDKLNEERTNKLKITIVPGGPFKLVVKEGHRQFIDAEPNKYIWVGGEPYPVDNETAQHFTAIRVNNE